MRGHGARGHGGRVERIAGHQVGAVPVLEAAGEAVVLRARRPALMAEAPDELLDEIPVGADVDRLRFDPGTHHDAAGAGDGHGAADVVDPAGQVDLGIGPRIVPGRIERVLHRDQRPRGAEGGLERLQRDHVAGPLPRVDVGVVGHGDAVERHHAAGLFRDGQLAQPQEAIGGIVDLDRHGARRVYRAAAGEGVAGDIHVARPCQDVAHVDEADRDVLAAEPPQLGSQEQLFRQEGAAHVGVGAVLVGQLLQQHDAPLDLALERLVVLLLDADALALAGDVAERVDGQELLVMDADIHRAVHDDVVARRHGRGPALDVEVDRTATEGPADRAANGGERFTIEVLADAVADRLGQACITDEVDVAHAAQFGAASHIHGVALEDDAVGFGCGLDGECGLVPEVGAGRDVDVVRISTRVATGQQVDVIERRDLGAGADHDGIGGAGTSDRVALGGAGQAVGLGVGIGLDAAGAIAGAIGTADQGAGGEVDVAHRREIGMVADDHARLVGARRVRVLDVLVADDRFGAGDGDGAAGVEPGTVARLDVVQSVEVEAARRIARPGHIDLCAGADGGHGVVRDVGFALGGRAVDETTRTGLDVVVRE